MLTIVTTPRPLTDKFQLDLCNAVGSWKCLQPRPQVLVFGGRRQFVHSIGATHIARFPHSKQGLPYLDSYVSIAQRIAKHNIIMLTSDHLILLSDFMSSLKKVSQRFPGAFAMIGQRWDTDVTEPIDFRNPKWESKLTSLRGRYRGHAAKDWFVFRLPLNFDLLPFVIGRRGWDTWFTHALLTSDIPVVDVTCRATTIHPTHDYAHVKGGVCRENSTDPGTLHNLRVYRGAIPHPKHISDATWGLTCDGTFLHGQDWTQWKFDKEREWEIGFEQHRRRLLPGLHRPDYCGWRCKWMPK